MCINTSRLAELVSPFIQRQNTNFKDCISPGKRLVVTLRFLETGESFKSLSSQFRIAQPTLSLIIPETCRVIYEVLKDKYLKCPTSVEEWQQVARGFLEKWHFPNCLGALDGRHIPISPPSRSGPTSFKNKSIFSIVFMALADSGYRFLCVDVACNGRTSKGGDFRGCSLQEALKRRIANTPVAAPLPECDQLAPYTIVADEAFPLTEYMVKPYPNQGLTVEQQIFNYRLSRAWAAVENAIGILANRWGVILTTVHLRPETVELIVLSCCSLHNFLTQECREKYLQGIGDQEEPNHTMVPGAWKQDPTLPQAPLPHNTSPSVQALQHRDSLCQYFNSGAGAVDFQWDKIKV
ncbi:hypothetical protein AAFF_G00052140 [Aldrovandia affinis]|uniref:DDE Tnp4 domain-containing protein n=1 Tax=Aldrovandia affinis TaxID=143900 RepID=A0AAD7WZY8_9TELE|nr:hypothetical protein AAFF_G00052140 [Aldrovandia affinis]